MKFDPSIIDGHLLNLRNYVSELKRISSINKDTFLSDPDKIGSAKYYLLVAIESCIDIAHHLIAANFFRRPKDYSDAFKILLEEEILPHVLLLTFQNMAKFRNLLVHQYAKVDDLKVFEFLQKNLQDFDAFARIIANQIKDTMETKGF